MGFWQPLFACFFVGLIQYAALVSFGLGLVTALIFLAMLSVFVTGALYVIWKHRQAEPFDDKQFNHRPEVFARAFPEVKDKE